ncbi:unnamed protein product [Aphis gossypii]|uniref:Uncharacterized protein n=1 Tax=Aphis gossypii TaxID=80765 RepID=A0A9P0NQV7_APHGO|nr:unnamed protein product [Aphis gossypii]
MFGHTGERNKSIVNPPLLFTHTHTPVAPLPINRCASPRLSAAHNITCVHHYRTACVRIYIILYYMYHGIRVCYYYVYLYIIIILLLLYIHTSRVVGGGLRTVFNALSHCHSSTCPAAAAGAVTHRCCSSREQLGIFTCI